MSDKAILKKRLSEAEDALHLLMIGQSAVSISTDGIGQTTFKAAEEPKLRRYILSLKQQLGMAGSQSRRIYG